MLDIKAVSIPIRRLMKLAGLFLACALFANYFAINRAYCTKYYAFSALPELLDGVAPAPFQYRALFFWVISWIQQQGWFYASAESLRDLCYILEFVFCNALFVVMWLYLGLFIRSDRVKAVGLLLLAFVLCMTFLVPRYLAYYYIYDVPAAIFFTLGLYLLRQKRMLPFYALYAVASFNRETFLFITGVYVLVNWRLPKRQLFVSVVVQGMIAITVRVILMACYGVLPPHPTFLVQNSPTIWQPNTVAQFMTALGFLWMVPLLGWRLIHDPFLRRAYLLLPVVGVVAFCLANIDEVRAYGEYIGLVLPPSLLVFQRIFAEAGGESGSECSDKA
jgi:hypothetical protein